MMSATPGRRHPTSSQSHPQSQSRRRSTARSSDAEEVSLPPYQPPEAPLTLDSQRQIAVLLSSHHLRTLRTHLEHAAEKLTHSGGEVNERLCDARARYEKSKEVRRRQGDETVDDDEGNEEYQRLAEAEARVDAVSARMEEKTRLIVDSELKLQGLTEAMTQIEGEALEAVNAALGVRQTRQQRAVQRADAGDDADGEDPEDGDYEDPAEREARERNAQNPPSRKLDDRLMEGVQKWNALSLTEKYASNNSYIGFYRMVHDSKFPGDDVPPLPHSSTWFNHMEDINARSGTSVRTRNRNRDPSPADSDDIAIERERVSLKCPLTLTPYVDPVTSTKCPHSFERTAIMDMITRSKTTIAPPASRRNQRRIHMVKCPVCSIPLTADDLRPDPVLLRRVRRAQELQEREDEDDHLEGDGRKQKDRSTNITLASDGESDDDAMDVDAPPTQRIKPEPLSQAADAVESDFDDSDDDAESADAENDGELPNGRNREEYNNEEDDNNGSENAEEDGEQPGVSQGNELEDANMEHAEAENQEEEDGNVQADVEGGEEQDGEAETENMHENAPDAPSKQGESDEDDGEDSDTATDSDSDISTQVKSESEDEASQAGSDSD
ncbi:Zinc finger RING/FYVE/PHD-type [Penicillium paradoxum]|uniref:Zinc finger RING/FYVE/PHD-type n=1 Tax=Penicillium paradoxum TaxID=176176 RepID=UPI002548E3B0|nr:Zinc finger RING/FYVE/PHD-type [Penicillium paradoxum]KAJ5773184.1 Zinc finger RING/FYVE/PHD-type [Penicillium paradoxum]